MTIPTMRVVHVCGTEMVINVSDFNPKIHRLPAAVVPPDSESDISAPVATTAPAAAGTLAADLQYVLPKPRRK